MRQDFIARQSIMVSAPLDRVWRALVDPGAIKAYMFGTEVASDWSEGGPITWKGEWQGKAYEDHGVILALEPRSMLRYSHFSPLSGLPDVPENYHTVTIELTEQTGGVRVTLSQDNNPTEQAREHAEANWKTMLTAMKEWIETA